MKINLAVFFGGKTTEHEVSIISAVQAMHSLDKEKYEIIPIYIDKKGDFYYNPDGKFLDINNYKNIPSLLKSSKKVVIGKDNDKVFIRPIENSLFGSKDIAYIDVAFPIVHGTNVEDGTLQGFLHMFDLPFVGPNVLASALGMDKYAMKKILQSEGVPVLDGAKYNINDYRKEDILIKKIEMKFEYPIIVKPINLGSSIGITVAHNTEELKKALEIAFNFAEEIIVEKAITNLREINVSVCGDKYECHASACEEPHKKGDILSFSNKYLKDDAQKGMTSHGKADIDEETEKYIKKIAMDTFKVLGCSGVARVDCMIDADTNTIYVNEINTIPGSLSFYLWEKEGIKYQELLDELIKSAIDEHRREGKLTFSFENNLLSNHKLFKNK